MSLSKTAPLAWRYYAEEVAAGREDYFAAGAERPGRFLGRGAEALGIAEMEVTSEAMERLFGRGCDPRDGAALGRSFSPEDERAVAGFALTFSPPKTVSVLWALGDQAVSSAVLAAHEAAVAEALVFLEDHAAFTRRGHGGILQVDTDGLVVASFVHRTSRASDPQLHTHVLVANKVRAKDGHWLSLDARELFCHQKAAGMLYKAALRSELSARCGVSWTSVDDNGIAEVEGVPVDLCAAWSARRQAVKAAGDALVAEREAALGRSLTSSERAQCFQLAAYRTRTPKVDAETPTEVLKERWHEEAVGFGRDPAHWLPGVLGHERAVVVTPGVEELSSVLARLEECSATWTRADVVEECARLVGGPDAASVRRAVEALADKVVSDPEVVSLEAPLPVVAPEFLRREDGMAQFERHGGRRFSTTGTLRREAAVLEAAAAGAGAGIGIVPEAVVTSAIGVTRLGEDQEAAVRGLLGGGEQVALLVGPAGSGKSRALSAARTAWEASGHELVGAAPSAMAADVLEEASGIASDTLAKLLGELERGQRTLSSRSVVVVDEAGMARSDDLARLVTSAQAASVKVVLVGDPHQLGAVGPGGLFRTLVDDHGAHELETIRRFTHAWEAAASLRLRARDPSILPAYVAHDRILEGSRPAMLDAALRAWRAGRASGRDVLVMAGDNATADELSRRCRAERVQAGEVERDGVAIASGIAGVGDEVVTLRNNRSLRSGEGDFVRNGARWRVVERDRTGALQVEPLAGGGRVALPPDYVARHVGLAYALTIHKAQGTTSDEALVLVDDKLTAAQLYVAMSRGREENRALVVTDRVDPDEHVRPVEISGIEQLVQVLRRDGTDRSAHEVLREQLARSEDRELLRGLQVVLRERIEARVGPSRRDEIAALERRDDLPAAEAALREAEGRLAAAEARRLAAEASADRAPMLRAHLPGALGARARQERRLGEENVAVARHGEQRALRELEACRHHVATAQLVRSELEALREQQRNRDAYLDAHPDEVELGRSLRRLLRDDRRQPRPADAAHRENETDVVVRRRRLPTYDVAPSPSPTPVERQGPTLGP